MDPRRSLAPPGHRLLPVVGARSTSVRRRGDVGLKGATDREYDEASSRRVVVPGIATADRRSLLVPGAQSRDRVEEVTAIGVTPIALLTRGVPVCDREPNIR